MKYKIVRFFRDKPKRVIREGLTLEEAMAHCEDPETSSRTATSKRALQITAEEGPWFDGWTVSLEDA